ncbi:MAG: hypothetical protein A3E51_19045 [Burkholderiales bacterium RIFCSPHIGHO2_12_FULL_67_38]|nr:MAG: hypothetical protein A3I64_07915 [Burkholderiales bacterium RIFCSPLOWO2_02_FULL_67_64]OGB47807.1 MAG: hypothetical protein A3E51_19045 [Burkholderiales bacterium RIFCSPHIGHO2_12_FULL_67_38]
MPRPARPVRAAVPGVGIGWRHPHYAELLQNRPALDFIEVHSENFFGAGGAALAVLREGRAHYPVSLHGVGLSLGSASGIDPWHLDQLAHLVQAIDPVRVSDHASFARGQHPGETGQALHAVDLLPVPFSRAALDAMCANVQRVQDRLRRPIAVENLSAYVRWRQAEMDEPEFLNTLAQRSGCQLLVDVNNIAVNALNAQLRGDTADPLASCARWLDAIAPAHVAEIHLAGHVHCGDIVIDDHGSRVRDDVWALYRHALRRFGAVPTLIEWDTDVPALAVLLDEAERARAQARHALRPPATTPDAVTA